MFELNISNEVKNDGKIIFQVLQLPFSDVANPTGLEQLLQYQLGVGEPLQPTLLCVSYPSPSTNYSSEDI